MSVFRSAVNGWKRRDENVFRKKPGAILESALLVQQHPDLKARSAATLRAMWRAAPLINAAFRRDPHHRALFMEILRQPRGLTSELRLMNRYGILGRYMPAFGRIVGQMQHDLFHVYTVDEHILMVVRNLRRFIPRSSPMNIRFAAGSSVNSNGLKCSISPDCSTTLPKGAKEIIRNSARQMPDRFCQNHDICRKTPNWSAGWSKTIWSCR